MMMKEPRGVLPVILLMLLLLLSSSVCDSLLLQLRSPRCRNMVAAWTTTTTVACRRQQQVTTSRSSSCSTSLAMWSKFDPSPSSLAIPGIAATRRGESRMDMAGFGDASSNDNNNKEVKLKPKQQWDRYTALKQEPSVVVGVKVVLTSTTDDDDDDDKNGWFVVGAVKCASTISVDVAVARQRALLVEVCSYTLWVLGVRW